MNIKNNKFLIICVLIILFISTVFAQVDEDDDEYVPVEKIQETVEEKVEIPNVDEIPPPKPLNIETSPLSIIKNLKFKNPILELCIFSALILYFINVTIGKRKNEKIAKEWLVCTYPIWKENFASLGIDEPSTLVRDGNHEFWYYATGRRYCESVFTRVKLSPRQDIILSLYGLYKPEYDRIVMEVVLNKKDSDDFVFAMIDRKKEAEVKKTRYDLKKFTRRYKGKNAPSPIDYTVLTDAPAFADKFFDNTTVKHAIQMSLGQLDNSCCKKNKPWIESIIISDQSPKEPDIEKITSENPPPPPQKILTVTARIPTSLANNSKDKDVIEIVREFTNLTIKLIDFIGENGRVDNDTKNKLKKVRDNAQAAILRQIEEKNKKELNKKKIEMKRARESEISKMSAEKQKKYEEKMRKQELKRELKKKSKKGKMII